MPVAEIPLSADNQIFAIQLADRQLRLRLLYRDEAGWVLDILEADETSIVSGIPLVTGVDLLAPFKHLGFGASLRVVSDDVAEEYPTKVNLGFRSHLYFVTPD
ncbi:phage baseplate plug family protein [Dryocola sp. BD586]|uniref:phage baseplate plug family protein n=1 Tax=Dryocola sp. BD586 TaxID=3133271 RepID=UPI003F50312F